MECSVCPNDHPLIRCKSTGHQRQRTHRNDNSLNEFHQPSEESLNLSKTETGPTVMILSHEKFLLICRYNTKGLYPKSLKFREKYMEIYPMLLSEVNVYKHSKPSK